MEKLNRVCMPWLLAALISGGIARAESLAHCGFVEAQSAGKILVECSAIGDSVEQAVDIVRKGCLEWLVSERILASDEERQHYQAAATKIQTQLDRFVPVPGPASRSGRTGIVSRFREADNRIRLKVILAVDEDAVKSALEAAGVIARPTQQLRLVLIGRPGLSKQQSQTLQTLLAKNLASDSLLIVDPDRMPGLAPLAKALAPLAAETEAGLRRAMAAGADLVLLVDAQRQQPRGMGQDAVAFAVGLELIEVTTGRVLAAEHKMGGARFAGEARQVAFALIGPATDAVVELRAQLDQLRRRGGVGDGLLVALRGKAIAELETYLQLLKKRCQRVGQNGEGVEVVGLSATGCPAERKPLFQALRELAGAKNRFVSNQYNVVLIEPIGK